MRCEQFILSLLFEGVGLWLISISVWGWSGGRTFCPKLKLIKKDC
jgi:hypothetical protein